MPKPYQALGKALSLPYALVQPTNPRVHIHPVHNQQSKQSYHHYCRDELDQETNNLLVSLFSETQFHLLDVSSHGSDLTTENYAVPAHTILPVVLHSLPD